ncbi:MULTISPECIES: hypothetical protein [unclassified Limnobacter]|uniref:hypothetical protein n=1 Tax=unclassified Limnobacter TaxID=2630203 RepID=UPI001443FEE4|nr:MULTISPECIES: hypothetical protein [unclassified Limnobacter]MDP3272961.1 hypothetical protein [Limnobacter sp.]
MNSRDFSVAAQESVSVVRKKQLIPHFKSGLKKTIKNKSLKILLVTDWLFVNQAQ